MDLCTTHDTTGLLLGHLMHDLRTDYIVEFAVKYAFNHPRYMFLLTLSRSELIYLQDSLGTEYIYGPHQHCLARVFAAT